jgi:hypothetical protein
VTELRHFVTSHWTVELPEGWRAGRSGRNLQFRSTSTKAEILVSDLVADGLEPGPDDALEFARQALRAAGAGGAQTEPPFATDDGRFVALGHGTSPRGYCAVAAHAWPGRVVIVTLFQLDGVEAVRQEARAISLSLARVDPADRPRRSLLGRLLGR